MSTARPHLNLNTLLLTIVMALSAWTLKTVYEMSNGLTAVTIRVNQHDKDLGGLQARISQDEMLLTEVRVKAAR